MPTFVIFVEGADTEPAKMPVYIVESEEHASLICEGMKEGDYQIFDFSFKHCSRSDRGKFAVWATMICDAREGVYGNIVGGIYNLIDGAYSIMSGRRSREKIASGADTETGNSGSTTQAKQDGATADDNGQSSAAKPSAAGSGDGDQTYRELGKWAAAELKGKQRRVVELLTGKNGKMPIPDLKLACGWEGNEFARCRQHVNRKLRKAGWIVERHDNEARLRQVKGRQK